MAAVQELQAAYDHYREDPAFLEELHTYYRDYAGRPSMLYYAEKMTKDLGGAAVYIKREDLNHTGSHKINNVLGQVLAGKEDGQAPPDRGNRRRPARGGHRHRPRRSSAWNARCSWVRRTWSASLSTYTAWSFWGRRSPVCPAARAP